MGWSIVWTEPALQDLGELVRFIAKDNPDMAVRVGDEIVDHVEILKTFPEIGPIYRRRETGDVRQITCRPFRVFYRVRKREEVVEVLHVWHGARQEPVDI